MNFKSICRKILGLRKENLIQDIFDCPQIRQLMKDIKYVNSMTELEYSARNSFVLVAKNSLGYHKSKNYGELAETCHHSFATLEPIRV